MTVMTFFALWMCLNIVVAGVWGLCVLFADVHQRGLARVRYDAQRQDR